MKYNPKINEKIARIPGFSAIHPLQDEATVQGALELLYDLSEHLEEITGMDEVTLQPAAGAHGEWTGLMMIRAFHEANGDHKRTKVIVPDSPRIMYSFNISPASTVLPRPTSSAKMAFPFICSTTFRATSSWWGSGLKPGRWYGACKPWLDIVFCKPGSSAAHTSPDSGNDSFRHRNNHVFKRKTSRVRPYRLCRRRAISRPGGSQLFLS